MSAASANGSAAPYQDAVANFDLQEALSFLAMDESGHVNAAEICCTRYAGDAARVALRHRAPDGSTRDWTFAELDQASARFAGVLRDLGVHLDFWKVLMRPGKPLMFGTRGKTLVFGLPGNPISAFVTANAASYLVGYLAIIAPAGIGFREVVLATVLPPLGIATAPQAGGLEG